MVDSNRKSKYPMIPVDEALELVLSSSDPLPLESVNIFTSSPASVIGRVIAADVIAPEALPPFAASMMDGYAVVAEDGEGVYPVVSNITAGCASRGHLSSGSVAYITTGAPLPPGANAVVPVEDTSLMGCSSSRSPPSIRLLKAVHKGKWVRPLGSDVSLGDTILRKGDLIGPAEIGVLSQTGCGKSLKLFSKPRVGVLSTGDELISADSIGLLSETFPGKIRDSNRPMLLAAAAAENATSIDLGMVMDDNSSLERIFQNALTQCDILVTSGGVSMGSLDLVKPLLERIGQVHFGRMCMYV